MSIRISKPTVSQIQQALTSAVQFSKDVDRRVLSAVRSSLRPGTERIVRRHYETALSNLRSVYGHGRKGPIPATPSGRGKTTVEMNLKDVDGSILIDSLQFWALAKSTRRKKRGWPGASTESEDTFFLFKGNTLINELSGLHSPDIDVFVGEIERAGARRDARGRFVKQGFLSYDFELAVTAERMPYPLDELIRRPVLLGSAAAFDDGGFDDGEDGEFSVIMTLEKGRPGKRRIPARPFIKLMSRSLHQRMKERIIRQA